MVRGNKKHIPSSSPLSLSPESFETEYGKGTGMKKEAKVKPVSRTQPFTVPYEDQGAHAPFAQPAPRT